MVHFNQSAMNDFYVDKSPIQGYGCFSNRKFNKGERVYFHILPIDKPHNLTHVFPFNGNLQNCIVLSEFSYCNHSDNPNFEMVSLDRVKRIKCFECIKPVDIYDEITIYYGSTTNFN